MVSKLVIKSNQSHHVVQQPNHEEYLQHVFLRPRNVDGRKYFVAAPALAVVPNLAQFVTDKHTRDNYILWKTQVVPILCSANLMGYLDGSTLCLESMIAETRDGATMQVPNQERLRWVQVDQLLLSDRLSTLTIDVLASVMMLQSPYEVWNILERLFSATTTSKVMQLCMQLSHLSEDDLSATVYFHKVKNLTDAMSTIGRPFGDEEIIAYLVAGHGEDYDSLVDSITARTEKWIITYLP